MTEAWPKHKNDIHCSALIFTYIMHTDLYYINIYVHCTCIIFYYYNIVLFCLNYQLTILQRYSYSL